MNEQKRRLGKVVKLPIGKELTLGIVGIVLLVGKEEKTFKNLLLRARRRRRSKKR